MERQVPPIAKQPPERLMPLIPVVVPAPKVRYPPTARLVVVALVPVAEVKVKAEMVLRVAKRSVWVAEVTIAAAPVSIPGTLRDVEVAPVKTPLVA